MKRLLALVAAVAMVAGAVWARGQIDDGDGDGGGDGGGSDTAAVVVCVTELAPACDAVAAEHPELEVRIEDEEVTETALVAGEAGDVDAWLTFAPFVTVVNDDLRRAGGFPVLDEPEDVSAWSPLVVVVWTDRRDVLAPRCDGEITWRCIGEVSGAPWSDLGGSATWGPVKPSHPTPETTGVGLLVLAQAGASFFGTPDYASNDFADPAFRAWFERLERGVPGFPRPPPLDEMLSKGPAAYDLTGTTEAEAVPEIERSRDRDRLEVLYPSPTAIAEVVLAPVAGSDAGGRVQDIFASDDTTAAFAGAGWQTDPAARPADDGLPAPGVLQALRALWNEVL